MKLAFYSEILAGNLRMDQDLYLLIGKKKPRIGYLSSETDRERKYFQEVKNYYAKYGFSGFLYFDLDQEYYPAIKKDLANCHAIHLSGGNTYHFLYHIKKRKFISFLRDYARNRGVLIGISAGAMIMTPEITTTTLFEGEPEDENKLGLKDFSALNLIDFEFFPHFESPDAEKKIKEYSQKSERVIYASRDGTGIIVDQSKITFYGKVVGFKGSGRFNIF